MTALYRQYRSRRFGDLIGQRHIVTTLLNEVRVHEPAHAYLFTGIRGTGKTSTARILARALNCLNARDGEPCNECTACVEITAGASVDVLEIDAASNRGIDEMRDLRDKVKYLPASLRYKVYVIDEAHMLTTEAWNAFLKTLEEPPAHVVFILATTEPQKIPDTVRSRVQRFDFRRVGAEDLIAHLHSIAKSEDIEVTSEAVMLVARAAQGSVRDALSLFDQAIALGERPVTGSTVQRALGMADPTTLRQLLIAVGGGDAASALRELAVAFDTGVDARQLLREMARLARATMFCEVGYSEGAGNDVEEIEFCQQLRAVAQPGLWLDVVEQCHAADMSLRQSVDSRLQTELCILRLTQRAHQPVPALSGGTPISAVAGPTPPPLETTAPVQPAAPVPALAVSAAPVVPPPTVKTESTVESWITRWPLLIEAVNRRDAMLAGILRDCKPIEANAEQLVIGAPYSFHLERLTESTKAKLLAQVIAELGGPACTVAPAFVTEGRAEKRKVGASGQAREAVLQAFAGSRITTSRLRDHTTDAPASKPTSTVKES